MESFTLASSPSGIRGIRQLCSVGSTVNIVNGGNTKVSPIGTSKFSSQSVITSISPCGWVCSLCFHPGGVLGAFLG